MRNLLIIIFIFANTAPTDASNLPKRWRCSAACRYHTCDLSLSHNPLANLVVKAFNSSRDQSCESNFNFKDLTGLGDTDIEAFDDLIKKCEAENEVDSIELQYNDPYKQGKSIFFNSMADIHHMRNICREAKVPSNSEETPDRKSDSSQEEGCSLPSTSEKNRYD